MENEVLGYQDVEISRDKNYEPAVLKKYRENKARAEQNIKLLDLFDKDVIILLKQHQNEKDKAKLNSMVRVLFA